MFYQKRKRVNILFKEESKAKIYCWRTQGFREYWDEKDKSVNSGKVREREREREFAK